MTFIGQMVHYVLTGGTNRGSCRAAIVVRVLENTSSKERVNLHVFTDSVNDYLYSTELASGSFWTDNVFHSEAREPGTWHYIEESR